MKREMLCLPCSQKIRKIILPSAPGEYSKFVKGKLKATCYCDFCGKPLEEQTEAEALSIYTDRIPYFSWESELIEVQ